MRSWSKIGIALRLTVFTAVIAALLAAIVLVIQRPVDGATSTYEALFTDASGLRTNADVRMYGVAVGKVSKVELDGYEARVTFTVQDDHPFYQEGKIAIRYQNLTGQRYVDIQQPPTTGLQVRSGEVIGTDQTIPSFDITSLFNGMEPVLAEFSPEVMNQFMENSIAVIEGDGRAVGATLQAVEKLTAYVSDRDAVISTLINNFHRVYDLMGEKSPETATLIRGISNIFVNLQKQFDGFMAYVDVAPTTIGPLNDLLAAIGLTEGENPDVQNDFRLLFPNPEVVVDLLNRLPGLLQSLIAILPPPGGDLINRNCSNGTADVPDVVQVLVAGQRVSICNG